MLTHRPVLVMEMPQQLNSVEARTFMQELEPLLDSPRPRIVFDCSEVHYVDRAGVAMILHCLEEAMKSGGDLKLAALSAESEAVLELRRMFEAFSTSDEAMRNFTSLQTALPKPTAYANEFGNRETLKKAG
jgi:anti-sigma B factor antagonist